MSVGSTFYGTFLPKNCSTKWATFLARSLEARYWERDRTTAAALVPGQPGTEAVRCARWALDRKIVALPRKYRKWATFLANVTLLQNEYHRLKARILLLWTHAQNLHFWTHFANTQCHCGLFQWSRGHIAGTGSKKKRSTRRLRWALRRAVRFAEYSILSYIRSCHSQNIPFLICTSGFYWGRDRDRSVQYRLRSRPRREAIIII